MSGDPDGKQSCKGQDDRDHDEDNGIPPFDAKEKAGDEVSKSKGRSDAEDYSGESEAHAVPHDEAADLRAVGTEGHTDAHLLCTLLGRVGHKAVDSNARKQKSRSSKDGEQKHVEVFAGSGVDNDLFHGPHAGDGEPIAGLT